MAHQGQAGHRREVVGKLHDNKRGCMLELFALCMRHEIGIHPQGEALS